MGHMQAIQREGAAWLLADSRTAEPRARLAQVMGRAEFLAKVPRALSPVQPPDRGLESLVDLLVPGLIDIVQVCVSQPDRELVAHHVRGGQPSVTVHPRESSESGRGLLRVTSSEVLEEVMVSTERKGSERTLRSFLHEDEAVELAADLRVESLVVLPLSARGRAIGSMVLGRAGGRGFSTSQPFLSDLAERVSAGLDAMLALDESRRMARLLTTSLAPDDLPSFAGLATGAFFRPAHRSAGIGGDFYSLHGTADDLTLVCGDVSGKGVEAAILAKRIRNAFRTGSHVDRDPGFLMKLLNDVLIDEHDQFSGKFATALCLRLRRRDDGSFAVDAAGAGHPAPLIVRTDGPVEHLEARGLALGVQAGEAYPTTSLVLGVRDLLVTYTDGVTEARDAAGEEFGDERLDAEASVLAGAAPESVIRAIAQAVLDHVGERFHDDLALVAVQPRPERR